MDSEYIKIPKVTEEQKRDRHNTISSQFTLFLKTFDKDYAQTIYLNKDLLYMVVRCYYSDITRYKAYSESEKANRHKQCAYTIKWISKLRPIQLVEGADIDENLVRINVLFSIYVGFSFLHSSILDNINDEVFENMVYTAFYRNISGRQFTNVVIMLEKCYATPGLTENQLNLSDPEVN